MPLLSTEEAFHVSDSFLMSLYGSETFHRWKDLKDEMRFVTEKDYVNWLLDVAYTFKSDEGSCDDECAGVRDTDDDYITDNINAAAVKTETADVCGEEQSHHRQNSPALERSHTLERLGQPSNDVTAGRANDSVIDGCAIDKGSNSVKVEAGPSYVEQYVEEEDTEETEDISVVDDEFDSENISLAQHNETRMGTSAASTTTAYHSSTTATNAGAENRKGSRKLHSCPHCLLTSRFKQNIYQHIAAVHEKLKPFSCPHCSYSASRRFVIKQHLIVKHGYRSNYCCDRCGKNCAGRSHLYKHYERCCGTG